MNKHVFFIWLNSQTSTICYKFENTSNLLFIILIIHDLRFFFLALSRPNSTKNKSAFPFFVKSNRKSIHGLK